MSIVLLLLSSISASKAQQSIRRHFIIAYDVSTPSIRAEQACPAFKKAVIDLFSNNDVKGSDQSSEKNLLQERKNNRPFFDKEKDEITFFHFGVSKNEMDILSVNGSRTSDSEIVDQFNKTFLKKTYLSWTAFQAKNNEIQVKDYLSQLFTIDPSPRYFGNGVSMSNFVYPLVLNQVDTAWFAQEYVLIILSDFQNGSALRNTEDFMRINDIFHVARYATAKSPVTSITNQIESMSSLYYKIDFFQYVFYSPYKNTPEGIVGYKIKPKGGARSPEDVDLFINSDLSLSQRGYKSEKFRISKTKIKFGHNQNLSPGSVRLTISIPSGAAEKILFSDIVASKNTEGSWSSNYTGSDNLMNFDTATKTYEIPSLAVTLDSAINEKNFTEVKVAYEFKTKYQPAGLSPVNFVYTAERSVAVDEISYSTKATIIFMYFVIPIVIILAVVLFLIFKGRPQNVRMFTDGFLDSFEKIDYQKVGKLHTPYKTWNSQQPVDSLMVSGNVIFKSPSFLFNWNPPVVLVLEPEVVPEGFELFFKQGTADIREFAKGIPMTVQKSKNNNFLFSVNLRQNDITKKVTDPVLVKFKVIAKINDKILFVNAQPVIDPFEYTFHIGEDLGDVWVAFDPGTSGSCIAVGNATDNIVLAEEGGTNEKIIPSILALSKAENPGNDPNRIPENAYKYGTNALGVQGKTSEYKSFQSIKKLLGFTDVKKVAFDNGKVLSFKGTDLASLLVKGLYKELKKFIGRSRNNVKEYKRDDKFEPLRAVVAIPNNFTINKIQDIVNCIGKIGQFKEIRYVYEAEAVLFYYLSHFKALNKDEKPNDSEVLLVFDMGGATINATVVTSNKTLVNNRPKYEIDFLAKIGYGVGGDTIDYCISKFILSFSEEYFQLGGISLQAYKQRFAELAMQLKLEFIRNVQAGNQYLITAFALETFINGALNINIHIDQDESEMYAYFKLTKGEWPLFKHPVFVKYVYDNIRDAVAETLALSNNIPVDKIVFSGRSTFFPIVKTTVEEAVQKVNNKNVKTVSFELTESKTAVAQGACWYGINKNSVILNNLKTNAAFGFTRTLSADQTDIEFTELVKMGCPFDDESDGISMYEGSKKISEDFAFDGSKVNFYQVMGKDAEKVLSENQKHKFSKVASVRIDQVTSAVSMEVREDDSVTCTVVLNTGQTKNSEGVVSDQEVDEANEEHYTWIVK